MIIYELWVCPAQGEFKKYAEFIGRGAAELCKTALEDTGNFVNVWIEERFDPDKDEEEEAANG